MNDFTEAISIQAAGTTFTDPWQLTDAFSCIDILLRIPTITGATPTLNVTPQISFNGEDYEDLPVAFDEFSSADSQPYQLKYQAPYLRFKLVAAGTGIDIQGEISALAKQ